jgi:hypothetical protein
MLTRAREHALTQFFGSKVIIEFSPYTSFQFLVVLKECPHSESCLGPPLPEIAPEVELPDHRPIEFDFDMQI